jgi:hypothetical protein
VYTNTQQDLTAGWCKITNYLDMRSFWLVYYFASWKATKSMSLLSRFWLQF